MWFFVEERNGWAPLALLLVATTATSCTVFDDVVPDPVPAPDGGGATGAGGEPPDAGTAGAASGGGGEAGDAGVVDGAYLPLDQAVTLCARVFACPTVGPSIRASIGVPVKGSTFSHCLHWLAGPLPENRPGIDGQRKMLAEMAAGTECHSTLAAAYVEKLVNHMDERCLGEQDRTCVNGDVIDCRPERLQIERCGSSLLGPATECTVSGVGIAACATGICGGTEYLCVGDEALSYCWTNLMQTATCAERGLVCTTSTFPYSCAKDGATQGCNTPGETMCDGDVAKSCSDAIGTTTVTLDSPFDCAAVDGGATCVETPAPGDAGPGVVHCQLDGSKCSPQSGDKCSGDVIELCLRGQPQDFNCADVGMTCLESPVPHCQ